MRIQRAGLFAGGLVIALCSGCAQLNKRQHIATMEPPLEGGVVVGEPVVDGSAPRPVTFVDRHPVLAKPRDIYNKSNHHKVVRVAAATVVGIPVGVVCETGQIIKGCPPGM